MCKCGVFFHSLRICLRALTLKRAHSSRASPSLLIYIPSSYSFSCFFSLCVRLFGCARIKITCHLYCGQCILFSVCAHSSFFLLPQIHSYSTYNVRVVSCGIHLLMLRHSDSIHLHKLRRTPNENIARKRTNVSNREATVVPCAEQHCNRITRKSTEHRGREGERERKRKKEIGIASHARTPPLLKNANFTVCPYNGPHMNASQIAPSVPPPPSLWYQIGISHSENVNALIYLFIVDCVHRLTLAMSLRCLRYLQYPMDLCCFRCMRTICKFHYRVTISMFLINIYEL